MTQAVADNAVTDERKREAGPTSEIQEAEEKLFMVDQGFNAEDIMNSKLFKMNMIMLEDDALKEDLSANPGVSP